DIFRRLTGGQREDGPGHNGAGGAGKDESAYTPGGPEVGQSESGATVYKYDVPPDEREGLRPPQMDEAALAMIDSHIERYVAGEGSGEGLVWHEIISNLVHIDVHVTPPSEERPYYTLITSGMSDLPMNVPPAAEDQKHAELLLCLPADWPLMGENYQMLPDDESYWPVHTLKFLARFPHEYSTWLGVGHTVPNGDPPQPFAEGVGFTGVVLLPPVLFEEEFFRLPVRAGKTIQFLAVVPLYESEMDFKLKHGLDALLDRFDENDVTELIDVHRPNVCPE
ncbi:MAG TPA: suppressor of fused domain protein, partial [Chloroflexia bacterium]|nr:suppressor of fused domain protein [Chloroflexia bacterium]